MKPILLPAVLLLGLALPAAQAAGAGTAGYAPSVQKLMQSADDLRASIHALARKPAGPERNQAIRDANRALLDVQSAMANAYDVTAFGPAASTATTTVAISQLECDRVGTMLACHR